MRPIRFDDPQRIKAPIALTLAFACQAAAFDAMACVTPPRSPLVINVKDKGAKGDGRTDDTSAIQAALDAVARTGGTVLVPDGRYMIDAVTKKGVQIRSSTLLKLSPGATLAVIPNSAEKYSLISIVRGVNVGIEGGTLEGDRDRHTGTTGEWGMGLRITNNSMNVAISGVTARKMWGDGIYISGARNVKVCNFTADSNRRQGISVVAVDNLLVTGSLFKNTHGTRPATGIDFEPNQASERITNVRVESSKFIDNEGGGLMIAGKRGFVGDVEIMGNTFEGPRAIVVEYARKVANEAICRNRHIVRNATAGSTLAGNVEAVPVVVNQDGCGDMRIVTRRGKVKKAGE